jgi:pimeloyl-CoA dehydrogenase small subunit
MDFDFNDEQRLLHDSVSRFLAHRYSFEDRARSMAAPAGWSADIWAGLAELGLLGLPFAEEDGGYGGGPVETMIVMQGFGRALVLEPYFATVILGGGLLRYAGSPAQRTARVARVASGELLLAFAHSERQSRYDLHDVGLRARRDGADWVLDGEKSLVLHGDSASELIVSARLSGEQRDRDGISLFIVDANAGGVARRGYPTQDGLRAAEVSFSDVRVSPENVLGEPGQAALFIERVVDEAIAALCAEAVGAMEEMHGMTVDYLKNRKQFGAPIGNFQVLQHRAADMFIALEQARSMAMFAAMMLQEEDPAARGTAIAAAKTQIGRSARAIGQAAIQLHGGIGMTMEYKVGHYFKRASMIDVMFGDADHHLARVAAAGGLITA